MINVAEKLKDCPKGTKLYSPLFGEVEFVRIEIGSIIVKVLDNGIPYSNVTFTAEGKCHDIEQSECLLFPSKDNRDWNKFNLPGNTLKPFDKVLVRDDINEKWILSIFGCYEDEVDKDFPYVCLNGRYCYCIPYEGNEHLLNTPNTLKDYRIKPEPKYRPFKNTEECWNEMQKHQPFGWLKDKNKDSVLMNIQALFDEMLTITDGVYFRGINLINGWHGFEEAVKEYTFADGTPFGIIEEE